MDTTSAGRARGSVLAELRGRLDAIEKEMDLMEDLMRPSSEREREVDERVGELKDRFREMLLDEEGRHRIQFRRSGAPADLGDFYGVLPNEAEEAYRDSIVKCCDPTARVWNRKQISSAAWLGVCYDLSGALDPARKLRATDEALDELGRDAFRGIAEEWVDLLRSFKR